MHCETCDAHYKPLRRTRPARRVRVAARLPDRAHRAEPRRGPRPAGRRITAWSAGVRPRFGARLGDAQGGRRASRELSGHRSRRGSATARRPGDRPPLTSAGRRGGARHHRGRGSARGVRRTQAADPLRGCGPDPEAAHGGPDRPGHRARAGLLAGHVVRRGPHLSAVPRPGRRGTRRTGTAPGPGRSGPGLAGTQPAVPDRR